MIILAKDMNPGLRIFARARYLQEKELLARVGAAEVCVEEGETAAGLATLLLREVGAGEERILTEVRRIQAELRLDQRPGAAPGPRASGVETR